MGDLLMGIIPLPIYLVRIAVIGIFETNLKGERRRFYGAPAAISL